MASTALVKAELHSDITEITGRQKVAVLCMALGPDIAAKITQRLNPDEIDAISFEIARMDRIDVKTVEKVMEEWNTSIMVADSLASGGIEVAREILEKAFGQRKATTILERIQSQLANT